MPQQNTLEIITHEKLKPYYDTQVNIPHKYNPNDYFGSCHRLIEEQSASFLSNYISGKYLLTPDALDLMNSYLSIMRRSSYNGITKQLKQAREKLHQDEKQVKLNAINRHKEEELIKRSAVSHFSILNNKKEAKKLSSRGLLLIADLLKEQDYSTKRLNDKLHSYALLRIEKTLKGELFVDEDFERLVRTFGTNQQKNMIYNRKKQGKLVVSPIASTVSPQPKQPVKHKKSQWFKRFWKKAKHALVASGIVILGVFGGKYAYENLSQASENTNNDKDNFAVVINPDQNTVSDDTIPTLPSIAQENTPNTEDIQTIKEEQNQTPDTISENSKVLQDAQDSLNSAYRERFDSALEILIGKEARDLLYAEVDKLAQDGKIVFKEGTTREWYAHAFTMYNIITPYSEENSLIQKLRAGENVSSETIHALVIKAERSGEGVKGTGSHSAFAKAKPNLQKRHINNRQKVKDAEVAFEVIKGMTSR